MKKQQALLDLAYYIKEIIEERDEEQSIGEPMRSRRYEHLNDIIDALKETYE